MEQRGKETWNASQNLRSDIDYFHFLKLGRSRRPLGENVFRDRPLPNSWSMGGGDEWHRAGLGRDRDSVAISTRRPARGEDARAWCDRWLRWPASASMVRQVQRAIPQRASLAQAEAAEVSLVRA